MAETVSQAVRQFINTISDTISGWQFIFFLIIWAVAWLVQPIIRRLLNSLKIQLPPAPWRNSLISIINRIAYPLTVFTFIQISIGIYLGLLKKNAGFLDMMGQLVFMWFVYRLITAIIDVNFTKQQASFWNHKIVLPLAVGVGILITLDLLEDVLSWGFYIDSIGWSLTIGSMLVAILIIIGFIFVAKWIRVGLTQSFLSEAGFDPALATTISKIIAYLVVTLGVLIAMGSIGIDLTTLSVIAGGLSVGLAFGLQDVVNNIVSGFIILFERSVQQGNIVDINDNVGKVEKVGIRSTIIRTRDNIELIIPNSYFLTEIVTNMTHSEDLVRIRINVGVSYNANPREVEEALLEVSQGHDNILPDPIPTVQFIDFGDSSLNFQLLVWTNQAIEIPQLTSDIRFGIWEALAKRNIEIPFPQRDIHIRSGIPSDLFGS